MSLLTCRTMSEQDKNTSKKGTQRRVVGGNTPNEQRDGNTLPPSNSQIALLIVDTTATSSSQPMFNRTSGAFGLLANFAQQVSIPFYAWS